MNEVDIGLKSIQLEILKTFIEICNNNNFQYYLAGGTCLGAIRHHGFIPWDDDIDVLMPRIDYEKFLSVAQNILPNHLFLQTFKSDPEYPLLFAKIRNSNTTYIEKGLSNCNINHGIYIDVFPLDYYPDNRTLSFRIKNMLLRARASTHISVKPSWKMRLLQLASYLYSPSYTNAIYKNDLLYKSVKETDVYANYSGAWGKKEIHPKSYYGNGLVVPFESLNAIVPVDYDNYLKKLYGDYMVLPPLEERIGHHEAVIIDSEHPYSFYS